jgi:hypothetical protein
VWCIEPLARKVNCHLSLSHGVYPWESEGEQSARWKIHSLFLEWLIIFIIQNRKITEDSPAHALIRAWKLLWQLFYHFALNFEKVARRERCRLDSRLQLNKKLCQLVAEHTQINFSFTTCDTHRDIWWLSFTCMGPIQNIHILFWNEVTNVVFLTNMLKIKILISIQNI